VTSRQLIQRWHGVAALPRVGAWRLERRKTIALLARMSAAKSGLTLLAGDPATRRGRRDVNKTSGRAGMVLSRRASNGDNPRAAASPRLAQYTACRVAGNAPLLQNASFTAPATYPHAPFTTRLSGAPHPAARRTAGLMDGSIYHLARFLCLATDALPLLERWDLPARRHRAWRFCAILRAVASKR